ncbi:uncharacterized protein LOC106869743 [Octopus bimaculoides]|uniref:Uncharacterized protein n=1 Tax=Octopus bimaculoides TaxID=37653 RepID=A0A0L8HMN2_OCTBM|nr:uncharacterized protein LOC106869743 [Octopus bimaculoides]XP_014771086.1 uncharacterized protein LOC106869743 [Octopus bimaculoides]|eukprot:XP_014771085.1 PREDICTED: uncharacterized protein LOC106869743 [Octopus bimaculoides]
MDFWLRGESKFVLMRDIVLEAKHSIVEGLLRACFRQIIDSDEDNDFPLPLTRKCSSCRRKLEKVRNAEMSRSAQTPTANIDNAEATQKDCINTSNISESDSTTSSIHRRNNIPAEQDKYQITDFTPNIMMQFHPEAQSSKFAENLQMTRSAGNIYILMCLYWYNFKQYLLYRKLKKKNQLNL